MQRFALNWRKKNRSHARLFVHSIYPPLHGSYQTVHNNFSQAFTDSQHFCLFFLINECAHTVARFFVNARGIFFLFHVHSSPHFFCSFIFAYILPIDYSYFYVFFSPHIFFNRFGYTCEFLLLPPEAIKNIFIVIKNAGLWRSFTAPLAATSIEENIASLFFGFVTLFFRSFFERL